MAADVNSVKTAVYPQWVTSTATAPYHHGDLREALAAEAMRQVRAKGGEAVSLRAVALAVGVSASAAYHHFPDKTALMQEVGHRGSIELDRRTIAAAEAVKGRGGKAAVARLDACGAAYIGFAQDEPHLFRHTFGAACATSVDLRHTRESFAYLTLGRCLDDVDRLGLLSVPREGLDLLAWTTVHGFASLLIEGFLATEATGPLLSTVLRVLVRPLPVS